MGNRGSKSAYAVKEQRVDGSWYRKLKFFVFKVYSNGFREKLSSQNPFIGNNKLIDFNRTNNFLNPRGFLPYPASNFTISQISRRGITGISGISNKSPNSLSAWWLTGFVDAEGCFRISLLRNINYKEKGGKALPFKVRLYFQIGLHRKDEAILELIQSQLGGLRGGNL
jgi:hypothetical protein